MVCFRTKDGTTARQYCLSLGLTYHKVYKQLDRGLSLEEAIKHVNDRTGKKGLNHACYFYKDRTVRSLCKDNKEYQKVIYKHLHGHTLEEALKIIGVIQ